MTFGGRQIFLRNTTVKLTRHRGPALLRKRCEVVILIETSFILRPREVVPLQSNFHKGLPPLPMCPLWPYDDGS